MGLPALAACRREPAPLDAAVTERGSVEVTAQLEEIPPGAVFQRGLYDYATVLRYTVLQVHRGDVRTNTIYVAHYNPFKPRREAAGRFAPGVGGNVVRFAPRAVHRMALDPDMDACYMGAVVDRYFGAHTGAVFWAVWTVYGP